MDKARRVQESRAAPCASQNPGASGERPCSSPGLFPPLPPGFLLPPFTFTPTGDSSSLYSATGLLLAGGPVQGDISIELARALSDQFHPVKYSFFRRCLRAFPVLVRGKKAGPEDPEKAADQRRKSGRWPTTYRDIQTSKAEQQTGFRQPILKNFVLHYSVTRLFSSR